jgi:hypothetical protein
MNYTIVINGFVWVGCMGYYFLFARHWYSGPRMTIEEDSSLTSDEGLLSGTKDSREQGAISGKIE